jgi:hypothetical protein
MAQWLMRLVVVLFFAGLAGSAVVVAISFVEDLRILFSFDEEGKTDRHAG